MHESQAPWRSLLESIQAHLDPRVEVVRTFLLAHPEERAWARELADRRGEPVPAASTEDLWRLYAVSRVADALHSCLEVDAMVALLEGLGMERLPERPFHPVHHEIVEVLPGDGPFAVVDRLTPGFTLGPLVFRREGVRVTAGPEHADPAVANDSPLFWAWQRPERSTVDLSFGWGSNSQWRTELRRDLVLDGVVYFNVDGGHGDVRLVEDGLTREQADSLVRHRIALHVAVDPDAIWPWDTAVVEPLT
ncbi:MAG: hypothetical protein H6734_12270 [Alphaproteobacteria bacterium]|nr:hypothetical protein [Alphaproteobacteria bacterium]